MKHNLNKIIVMFACTFVITLASSHSCLAEDLLEVKPVSEANSEITDAAAGNEASDAAENAADAAEVAKVEVEEVAEVANDNTADNAEKIVETVSDDASFLNEDVPAEEGDASGVAPTSEVAVPAQDTNTLLDVQPFPDNEDNLEALETDANKAQIDSTADVDAVIPEIGETKSPFESFGNSILSKVDNDLFNQMSNIEKQTTLLRLELRREELKSRVEALRNARIKAQQEEDARIRAEEERAKDMENERQARIIAEQEKLKEKEIELEKVRQAKVVNDYMNQMLVVNQQWVLKNAELQKRIHELEEERREMYQNFRSKSEQLHTEISSLVPRAENVVNIFRRKMDSLNSHINQLKASMLEREDEIKQMTNPFADNSKPGRDDIDMSSEYAIVDITGKGDDVIAKIMKNDGRTFSVHIGSVLKNGEVVTAITDRYIIFENEGVQSYLYTGDAVREYEPESSFNGADRAPRQTEKAIVKGVSSNVLGNANVNKSNRRKSSTKEEAPVLIKKPRKVNGDLTFGSGTFIQ